MRDKDRIPKILATIAKVWHENPDLRLMQLLLNLYSHQGGGSYSPDPYFCEDDTLHDMLREGYGNRPKVHRQSA